MTRQFFRFGLVGVVGFVVDAGVLAILLAVGFDPYLGRVGSFAVAVTTTWALNRIYTFRSTVRNRLRQYARFTVVNGVGGGINLATYAWLISTVPLMLAWPILGVAAGALAGMLWNFFGSRLFVFSGQAKAFHDKAQKTPTPT